MRPVYFLFGDDEYMISQTVEYLIKQLSDSGINDFDRMIFYGSKSSAEEILSFCTAFPFTSEKKLAVVKEFDLLKEQDKQGFTKYFENPADFTYLVCQALVKELPQKSFVKALENGGYLYQAKQLSESALEDWLIAIAEKNGKQLSKSNARFLIEITGDDRALLVSQIEKFVTYLGENNEITTEIIEMMAPQTKEYDIFKLIKAIEENSGEKAIAIALRLLEQGEVLHTMLGMLNKYFSVIARIPDLQQELAGRKIELADACRKLNIPVFTYQSYVATSRRYNKKQVHEIASALLQADLELKSTSTDPKTIFLKLLSVILHPSSGD